jgi:HD superfamily phosphodiesterase
MKIMTLANLVNCAFNYVIKTSNIFKIDESHALKHSMDVYNIANKIYESEVEKFPYLEQQRDIIYTSAILHDMCDKKYMCEKSGSIMIKTYMADYLPSEKLEIIESIITRMSYSKVKVNGYPNLGEYQLAYHIVREADLLSAYDIDRCIIYGMYKDNIDYSISLERAIELFESRIFKYRTDKLFITNFSKKESLKLHKKAQHEIEIIKKIL